MYVPRRQPDRMLVPGEDGEPPAIVLLSPRSPSPPPLISSSSSVSPVLPAWLREPSHASDPTIDPTTTTRTLGMISTQLDRVASLQRYIDRRRISGDVANPPYELIDTLELETRTLEELAEEVEGILSRISPVVSTEEDEDLEALFYSSLRAGSSSRLRRFRDNDAGAVVIGTSNERSTAIDDEIDSLLEADGPPSELVESTGFERLRDEGRTTWEATRRPIGRTTTTTTNREPFTIARAMSDYTVQEDGSIHLGTGGGHFSFAPFPNPPGFVPSPDDSDLPVQGHNQFRYSDILRRNPPESNVGPFRIASFSGSTSLQTAIDHLDSLRQTRARAESFAALPYSTRGKDCLLLYCGKQTEDLPKGFEWTGGPAGGGGCGALVCARGLGNVPKRSFGEGKEDVVSSDMRPSVESVGVLGEPTKDDTRGLLHGCEGCLTADFGCKSCGNVLGFQLVRACDHCSPRSTTSRDAFAWHYRLASVTVRPRLHKSVPPASLPLPSSDSESDTDSMTETPLRIYGPLHRRPPPTVGARLKWANIPPRSNDAMDGLVAPLDSTEEAHVAYGQFRTRFQQRATASSDGGRSSSEIQGWTGRPLVVSSTEQGDLPPTSSSIFSPLAQHTTLSRSHALRISPNRMGRRMEDEDDEGGRRVRARMGDGEDEGENVGRVRRMMRREVERELRRGDWVGR